MDFKGCNDLSDKTLVEKWEKMGVTSTKDGKCISFFQANLKHGKYSVLVRPGTLTYGYLGPPTHAAAYKKFVDAEVAAAAAGESSHTGDSALITTALLIEKSQCVYDALS